MDSVVQVFKKQRERGAECERQQKRKHHRAQARRPNRQVGNNRVIDHGNIVRTSRQHHIVLFGSLQQIVEQAFVCLDLLLQNSIVDGRFVLGYRLAFLLVE